MAEQLQLKVCFEPIEEGNPLYQLTLSTSIDGGQIGEVVDAGGLPYYFRAAGLFAQRGRDQMAQVCHFLALKEGKLNSGKFAWGDYFLLGFSRQFFLIFFI